MVRPWEYRKVGMPPELWEAIDEEPGSYHETIQDALNEKLQ